MTLEGQDTQNVLEEGTVVVMVETVEVEEAAVTDTVVKEEVVVDNVVAEDEFAAVDTHLGAHMSGQSCDANDAVVVVVEVTVGGSNHHDRNERTPEKAFWEMADVVDIPVVEDRDTPDAVGGIQMAEVDMLLEEHDSAYPCALEMGHFFALVRSHVCNTHPVVLGSLIIGLLVH